MLSEGGNPRLTSLVTLLKTLGIRFFIVDEGFAHRGEALTRPKEQKSVEANWKYTQKAEGSRRKKQGKDQEGKQGA